MVDIVGLTKKADWERKLEIIIAAAKRGGKEREFKKLKDEQPSMFAWAVLESVVGENEAYRLIREELVYRYGEPAGRFSFTGCARGSAYCEIRDPHPPHFLGSYPSVRGTLDSFCGGNPGRTDRRLLFWLEYYSPGDAATATTLNGEYWIIPDFGLR